MNLKDKVAAITGATRGIGFDIAKALLAEGAAVFICGRDEARVGEAVAALAKTRPGARAAGIAADVRRHADCRRFIVGAIEKFGGLDILVNNAGIGIFKPVHEISPEEWDDTIATNLSAPFYCAREAIPHLQRRGGGYIFNVSSLAGVNAFAGGSAYNASKFGLNGFSEALMQDVRYDGIRVSYLMPGSVETDFGSGRARPEGAQAKGWKLSGEDVARAVVDLCSYPERALASRIELRPSRPPRK
jgi:NAD(P)-dependent dehydrogenase (short-subunit alcohol dehydrogenase family)